MLINIRLFSLKQNKTKKGHGVLVLSLPNRPHKTEWLQRRMYYLLWFHEREQHLAPLGSSHLGCLVLLPSDGGWGWTSKNAPLLTCLVARLGWLGKLRAGFFLSMRIGWASHNLVVLGSQISYMAAGFPQNNISGRHHEVSYDPTSATFYWLPRTSLDTWEVDYKMAWMLGGRAHWGPSLETIYHKLYHHYSLEINVLIFCKQRVRSHSKTYGLC